MTVSLRYAARSDVGMVRASNQDSAYAGPHLVVLCDGMGGPAGGDIASAVAVEHLMPLDADSHQAGELLGLLRDAVQDAHAELISRSSEDPDLAGLGTTCIAIMRSGNKLAMVHVGDSRAYLLRDGELTQVTTDHTFVEYLVETGRLTREQARRHPQRSVLLRVLGDAEGDVQLDESIREAVPGDRWLLCSDGLCGPVSAETIGEVLATVEDPGEAADQLIDLALRAGGPDNVTAVVVDVVDDDPQPQTDPQVVGSAAGRRQRRRTAASVGSPAEPAPGSTPASRAAALVAGLDGTQTDEEDEDDAVSEQAEAARATRRRQRRRAALGTLVLALALIGACFLGYRWTQTQYYVTSESDHVVIYRGIPQEVGPLALSHKVETVTTPLVSDLDSRMRERLAETVSQPSLAAAREYVEVTVTGHVATPSASPSPSPSASATATARATATATASASASPTPTRGR
ncbi:serine/threonine protein phosphatase [Actinomyces radicidentis]|uniref:Serine/threonine protein phosphatase n=1 Tax=Actinomyces radicidentis TaxID=111015 RepID=A0A0X8JDT8_ACTRD|nr:PP2C family serine/threonine-protein phosphatase [Actinomyces radicidentis]AMD87007.1 serine/threonine protein phosphatase [Actinomyces radicidentis]